MFFLRCTLPFWEFQSSAWYELCSRHHSTIPAGLLPCAFALQEEFYGCDNIIEADRECVESNAEMILANAKEENVAFLVVGDPFA